MVRFQSVAIVGVGLIGGSIGSGLLRRGLAGEVVGIGRRRSSLEEAREVGAITRIAEDLADGARNADVVVVCTPVEMIPEYVVQCGRVCPADCVITDAGSTKLAIVPQIESRCQDESSWRGRYVGSHPLAGSDRSGVQHANPDLLQDRVVVVTPTDADAPATVEAVESFWRGLGARLRRMEPGEHDAALAVTSHLPHVVAAALAAATPEDYLELTATGWADTTRIAAANPDLWQQILLTNRSHSLQALDNFEKVLADFRKALESNQPEALIKLLQTGKDRRDTVGN